VPPRTRKAAAVKPTPEEETNTVSEDVTIETEEATVETEEAPKKRRGGRAADPVTVLIRERQAAEKRLARAQKKAQAVEDIAAELAAAQAGFEAADAALKAGLNLG
jgi:hypothetical protein